MAVTLSSNANNDYFGFSVASLGDMNFDGIVDVIISALNAKICYVLYGQYNWHRSLQVSKMFQLNNNDGFKVVGDSASISLMGISLAGLNDMNGDGRNDFAFSVLNSAPASSFSSSNVVYVVYGKLTNENLFLSKFIVGIDGIRVLGSTGYYSGFSITGPGDVNADGYNDLVIGLIPSSSYSNTAGQGAALIFGSPDLTSDEIIGRFDGNKGMIFFGAGFIVSSLSDVNLDGVADFMLTAVTNYIGKGNSYLISYPKSLISPPSLQPSSFPSTYPSNNPTSFPSSVAPSSLPTLRTATPSTSENYTDVPTAPTISTGPTLSPTKVLKSIRPTASPSYLPTLRPSIKPSSTNNPTFRPSVSPTLKPSRKPSIFPTAHFPTSNPSSFPTLPNEKSHEIDETIVVTRSGQSYLNKRGKILFRMEGNGDITITGGRGRNIYAFLPSTDTNSVTSFLSEGKATLSAMITIKNFHPKRDVLDVSAFPVIRSSSDISYETFPFTLLLADNYRVIISSSSLNPLDITYIFSSSSSSSSGLSQSSFESFSTLLSNPTILIPVVVMICFAVCARLTFQQKNLQKKVQTLPVEGDSKKSKKKNQTTQHIVNLKAAKEEIRASKVSLAPIIELGRERGQSLHSSDSNQLSEHEVEYNNDESIGSLGSGWGGLSSRSGNSSFDLPFDTLPNRSNLPPSNFNIYHVSSESSNYNENNLSSYENYHIIFIEEDNENNNHNDNNIMSLLPFPITTILIEYSDDENEGE